MSGFKVIAGRNLFKRLYSIHEVKLLYRTAAKSTLCTCDIFQCRNFRRSLFPQDVSRHSAVVIPSRYKSKKAKRSSGARDDDDDDSDAEESDDKDSDVYEDVPGPDGYKHKKLHSVRCDNIIAHALGYSNSDTLKLFYSSKLLLEGQVLLKKSRKVKDGDTLDVIVPGGDDSRSRRVKRVEIVSVSDKLTKKGNPIVVVRVWRRPLELDETEAS